MHSYKYILLIYAAMLLAGCNQKEETDNKNMISVTVTATAYNAVERQTKKGNPRLAAWGDLLEDGVKAIAVSQDLISEGLDHNEKVEIEGLKGPFLVKDKMNKKWHKKIDIFMGLDEDAAKNWGKRKVEIRFSKKDWPDDKFSLQAR